jgi:hypothetical protein
MRITSRHLLLLVAAAVALALGVPGAASAGSPVSVTDPSDDAGSAPDIIKVTVADDGAGSFTFTIELATMPDLQPDGFIVVFLDTDRNVSTGRNGSEFYVGATPRGVMLARWSGTAWEAVAGANLQLRLTGSGIEFVLPQSLIGTAKVDVLVGATRDSTTRVDTAPDQGALSFPPRITQLFVAESILRPRVGRVMDARRIQAQLSTGELVRAPLTCRLTYRGKVLKPLAGGCRWKLAKALKNKRLVLTVFARYNGETVTTSFAVVPR